MKRRYFVLALSVGLMGLIFLNLNSSAMAAQDLREVRIRAEQKTAEMAQKAARELERAKAAARESRQQILEDREKLDQAIAEMEGRAKALEERIHTLQTDNKTLTARDHDLAGQLETAQGTVRELSGVIRMNAKDIDTLTDQSFLTGVFQTDTGVLKSIADTSTVPAMDQIRQMAALLRDLIRDGGAVSLQTCEMVNRSGKTAEAEVLVLGAFTAAYRLADETGFLNYTPSERKLYALSRLPSKGRQKQINAYMDGRSDAVPLDMSRGAALSQLTHELSYAEQIPKGGPIVWPILAILALAALICLERLFFILRRKINLNKICGQIDTQASVKNWEDCTRLCDRFARNPVVRVIRAGIASRTLDREDMENAVQEAILKEIPPMERFLSTLGMLAAIAPLLGLLGTVTGMIDTFHVITLHGTGDPRLMSGGISEALVTTMLGLSVAIPIMLAHTLLSRSVENTVGLMEEKAVALVNLVQTHREA